MRGLQFALVVAAIAALGCGSTPSAPRAAVPTAEELDLPPPAFDGRAWELVDWKRIDESAISSYLPIGASLGTWLELVEVQRFPRPASVVTLEEMAALWRDGKSGDLLAYETEFTETHWIARWSIPKSPDEPAQWGVSAGWIDGETLRMRVYANRGPRDEGLRLAWQERLTD